MPLIINGQRVDDAIVEAEFSQIKAYHENLGNISCCERDPEFRASARQNIVARVLLAQHAEKSMPPTPEAAVDSAVEKLKEEYGGESWFFARTGATPETMHLVRRDVDLDQRVRKVIESLGADDGTPSDDALRAFYAEHQADFMTPEEVRASHILKNPQADLRPAAFEELRRVRADLQSGADFDEQARLHSEKADEHIDLNFFKRGELAPEFETVAFSMAVGEISPVFLSPYGYHLVKVTDRKPSVPRPFDACRAEVEKMFLEHRRNQKTRELIDSLKATAKVEELEEEPVAY